MTRLEDGRVTYALYLIVKTTRRIPKPRTKQCFEGIRGKEKAMQQYHMMIFCFHHCLSLISQSNQRTMLIWYLWQFNPIACYF
jgi:hypothetical protein